MRLVIASCSVDYFGRLEAHLPKADRLIMVKADGSVSIHADDRAYKPLNWMIPPCTLTVVSPEDDLSSDATLIYPELDNDGVEQLWIVENTKGEQLRIQIFAIHSDTSHELGEDPGLVKDGVESHLQELLAEQIELLGEGYTLVRREYPTAIGPVDILSKDSTGATVAVEIKRRGGIDGVEQLTRYVELLNRDELLAPVTGVFAAQEIKPQARTLAEDRGIRCVTLDYEAMRGTDSSEFRLF
ncbi:endonuclease NucS [Corynebacterium falsenii]|uniref:endonuclease NucS n=1 Tax=Corynebacterium falsenii TaxID=108486 RepID=UPI003FD5B901